MKLILLAFTSISIFATTTMANSYVRGYTKSNGTYVQPHYRSDANNTSSDNWSTKGNTNPYTGAAGTKKNTDYNNGERNYYDSGSSSGSSNDLSNE